MNQQNQHENLTQLGSQQTTYSYRGPSPEMFESFPNIFERPYSVTLPCPEFSSLCPKTGQPDFATITIRYTPDKKCVETKSLKLYIFSWRNEGCFMETITNRIADDFIKAIDPLELVVLSEFNARGGIPLICRVEYSKSK